MLGVLGGLQTPYKSYLMTLFAINVARSLNQVRSLRWYYPREFLILGDGTAYIVLLWQPEPMGLCAAGYQGSKV